MSRTRNAVLAICVAMVALGAETAGAQSGQYTCEAHGHFVPQSQWLYVGYTMPVGSGSYYGDGQVSCAFSDPAQGSGAMVNGGLYTSGSFQTGGVSWLVASTFSGSAEFWGFTGVAAHARFDYTIDTQGGVGTMTTRTSAGTGRGTVELRPCDSGVGYPASGCSYWDYEAVFTLNL